MLGGQIGGLGCARTEAGQVDVELVSLSFREEVDCLVKATTASYIIPFVDRELHRGTGFTATMSLKRERFSIPPVALCVGCSRSV